MTSLTVPATVVTESIAASDTGTSLVYSLAGAVTSPGYVPGVPTTQNPPSYELLLKQWQDAKAALGADQGSGGAKTKVKVTTTDFETSSSEEEKVKNHKSPTKPRTYFKDLLMRVSDDRAALVLKKKDKETERVKIPQKPKRDKEPGTDVGADKARDKSTMNKMKKNNNREEKTRSYAAKGSKKKATISSSSESESTSESSESSEEERSRKKKSNKSKGKRNDVRSSSSESSDSDSSKADSDADLVADKESTPKNKRKSKHRKSRNDPDRSLKVIRILESRKIMFAGDGKEGPEHYLDRLEECKSSYDLSNKELLRAIPTTLSGDASVWFKTVREVVMTWRGFKKEFRFRYIGNVVRKDILRDLYNRSQAKGETIDAYLSHFRLIVGYLRKPPSMRKQMDIVWDQLLPEYRRFMVGKRRDDLADIARHGREYEEILELDRRYTPPPSKDKMHIKSAAYIGPAIKSKVAACADQGADEVAAIGENKNPPQNKGKNGQGNQSKGQGQQSKTQNNNVQNSSAVPKSPESDFAAVIAQQAEFMKLMQQNLEALTKAHAAQKEEQMRSPARTQGASYPQNQNREQGSEFKGACFYCKEMGHRSSECPKKQCYKCYKFGHFANRCPSGQETGKSADRCQGCGADGVKIHDCPRCKKVVELMGNGVAGAQNGPLHPQPTL